MDKEELHGAALSSSALMAMLEILNGGPEEGRLSPEERLKIAAPKTQARIGKIFVASTAEDMNEKDGHSLLWNEKT